MIKSIDQALDDIITGGAKAKTKTKNKAKTKSKGKSKGKTKTKSKTANRDDKIKKAKKVKKTKKTNKSKTLTESGNIKNDFVIDDTEKTNLSRQKRPIILKKNADENTEYKSVKNEKPSKTDNTYKPYDVAFLKRLKRSKQETITSDEESE